MDKSCEKFNTKLAEKIYRAILRLNMSPSAKKEISVERQCAYYESVKACAAIN